MLLTVLQIYGKCSSAVAFQRCFKLFSLRCIYLPNYLWTSSAEQICLSHLVVCQRLPGRYSQNMIDKQTKPTILVKTETTYKEGRAL